MIDYNKMLQYNPDIEYVLHEHIVSYDMTSADVSVCKKYKLLSDTKIEQLELMPKEKRNRTIGCIRRDDPEFSKKLQNGILKTRQEFIDANGLNDTNIISLHSDAIIFYSKKKIKTDFGAVQFRLEQTASGYMKYQKIELFYNNGLLDIKPKNILDQHRLGLCVHIMKVFDLLENYNTNILREVTKFQTLYLQQKLPEYYYIPFIGNGKYFNSNLDFLSFLTKISIKEIRLWGES